VTTKEVDVNPQAARSPFTGPGVSQENITGAKAAIDLSLVSVTGVTTNSGVTSYTVTKKDGSKIIVYQFQGANLMNTYSRKPGQLDTKFYNGPGVPPGIPGTGTLPTTHATAPNADTPDALPTTHATTSAAFVDSLQDPTQYQNPPQPLSPLALTGIGAVVGATFVGPPGFVLGAFVGWLFS
jgi:hypothetical protein